MICPRGLATAKRYYDTFPHHQGLKTAGQICDGEIPDWTGHTEKSLKFLSIKVPEMDGFERWHAEQWVDLCTGKMCDLKPEFIKRGNKFDFMSTKCRPTQRIDDHTPKLVAEYEKEEIDDICHGMKMQNLTITKLKTKLEQDGIYPFAQIIMDNKAIGLVDLEKNVYLSLPSDPLKDIHEIQM